MNLGNLWSEIGRLNSDPNNDRWSQSVLTTRINQAQQEIQGITSAVKTQEPLTPVASTRALSLNANTMGLVRATKTLSDGTTVRPLPGKTLDELDYLYPDWRQWQDGEPLFFYYEGSLQQINLVPKPDASNAITNGITVWESRVPADLVNSTDIPFDSNNQMIPYHMAIAYRVAAQNWLDDGTPEALGKSKYLMTGDMMKPGLYEKQLGRIMAEFDVPEAVPTNILWRPQGGRVGTWYFPSKSNPLPWS